MSSDLAQRLYRRSEDLAEVEIVTPEGVPLAFSVAAASDRLIAFAIDGAFLLLGIVGMTLFLLMFGAAGPLVWAVVLLAFFLLRNGYFLWFELRRQGCTPGKARLGLRVIDAQGRMLSSDAIVVRNLTREVEVFLPLVALANPELIVAGGPGWVKLLSISWLVVFLILPLLNRQRRRIGDLLAGTLVVREHRVRLGRELSSGPEARKKPSASLHFTGEQLAVYGIYELQVLEDILRDDEPEALAAVAERIQKKIAWRAESAVDAREFLDAFYQAQRSRLEGDLLLGRAREKKRDGRLGD